MSLETPHAAPVSPPVLPGIQSRCSYLRGVSDICDVLSQIRRFWTLDISLLDAGCPLPSCRGSVRPQPLQGFHWKTVMPEPRPQAHGLEHLTLAQSSFPSTWRDLSWHHLAKSSRIYIWSAFPGARAYCMACCIRRDAGCPSSGSPSGCRPGNSRP